MEELDEFYYYKKDLIGHGAFAIVYKGRSRTKNCDVAIKAIAKKNIPKTKSLLNKEIKILEELRELQHENLVALLKRVETTTQVYLVMEYCNGGDLADYLSTKVTISEPIIQHFFSQIAHGLEAMHKMGIVHRDLKPQNILLCSPPQCPNALPNQLIVKLADFGFARFLTNGGMAGTLCGSPMYMAPEVIMSLQYCAKADLWSVGTIMYQCLTGKAPFVAQTPQALKNFYERHRDLQPNIPEYCSPLLADLLLKLLKRNARDRIEFADFFVHPFLHKPLPQASPSRHLISQQQHEYNNYHGSSGSSGSNRHHHHQAPQQPSATAHLRAKYPPPISSPSSASTAVGGGSPRHYPYDQSQQRYGVSTTLVGGGAGPRFVAVDGAAATRQAPLRPSTTAISPTVGVRGGSSGAHSSSRLPSSADTYAQHSSGFTTGTAASTLSPQRQRTLSNEYADGAAKASLSKQSSSPAVQYAASGGPSNMSDSGDFTFLPPLMEKGGHSSQQKLQLGGSSSTLSGDNNPVRQVQVHSTTSAAHVRAVPVPSQRYAFAKMEERRNGGVHHSSKSPHFQAAVGGPMPAMAEEKTGGGGDRPQQQPRIPSVEEINLPETQFVVHPLKSNGGLPSARIRRNTVNDFSAAGGSTAMANASCQATILDASGIPKSATCMTLGFPPGSATARKFSVPSTERADEASSLSFAEKQPPVMDNIRYLSTSPRVGPTRIDEEEDAAVAKHRADEPRVTAALPSGSATKVNFALGKRIMNQDDDEEDDDELRMEEPASFPFVGGREGEKAVAAASANSGAGFFANNFANNNDANMMDESLMSQVMDSISGEDEELGMAGPASTTAAATGGGILMPSAPASNNSGNGHSPNYQSLGASPKSNDHLIIDAEPPPELEPETLMDTEHRQVLAKLRFVLELIEALINVAENKTNPIAMMMEGGSRKLRHQSSSASTSSASRRAEQLVLYVRSLHVLSSALVMAQRQVNAETLQPSPAVQNVLNQLNEKYHHCLARSQELASLGIPGADPAMTVVSAERIMYQHAIDLCQSAALDELFGNPQLCPKRYQTAYMMLHTLSEQVQNEQDKCVLAKYKNAVEKRMRILERQGFVTAVHVSERGGGSATAGGLQKNSLLKENEPV